MTILVECQYCFFVFQENPEKSMECCPECGCGELQEVREDWPQEA